MLESKLKPKTITNHKLNIRHLEPFIGKKLLPQIDINDIEALRDHRRVHKASNRSINMTIETLRLILRRYGSWEKLRKDYKKLKEPDSVGKALSLEEEARLLDACRGSISRQLYPAATLGIYGGLRHDEIRLLRWEQIDLEKECLTVGDSKTVNGQGRLVPLIGPALEAMKEWAALFPNRKPKHFVFAKERYAIKAKH